MQSRSRDGDIAGDTTVQFDPFTVGERKPNESGLCTLVDPQSSSDSVQLIRDPVGRVLYASPLQLDHEVEEVRLAQLCSLRHPALLSIYRVTLPGGARRWFQEQCTGNTLEGSILELGDSPGHYWERHHARGVRGVVRSFAQLAELGGELVSLGFEPGFSDPTKIWVRSDGGVRVRAQDVLGGQQTRAGLYSAPEELLGETQGTRSPEESLVYSLGTLLHHALTGVPPFPARDRTGVAHRVLSGEPVAQPHWPATLPAQLSNVVREGIRPDPRSRPATLRGFATSLRLAIESESVWGSMRRRRPSRIRTRTTLMFSAVLLLGLVFLLQAKHVQQSRSDLRDRLATSLDWRPFPRHGEEATRDARARRLLDDVDREAESWTRDPDVQLYQGWALLRSGRVEESLLAFQRSARFKPTSIAARVSTGIARLELGDRSGEADILLALSQPTEDFEQRLFQGAGAFYLCDYATAVAAFREAADWDRHSYCAWFHLALSQLHEGSTWEARRALAVAERIRPQDPWLLWLRAELLAQEGEGEEAVRLLLSHHTRFIEFPALLLRGGHLMSRLRQSDPAEEWLAQACSDAHRLGLPGYAQVEPLARGRVLAPRRVVLQRLLP